MANPSYDLLPPDPDCLEQSQNGIQIVRPGSIWRQWSYLAWLSLACIWIFTILFSIAAWTNGSTDARCARHLSTWSPMLDAVEYVDVQFQNAFHQPSIYRGTPNKEREQAWLDLWNFGNVNIPLERLPLLNKSVDGNWKRVAPEHGGGVYALIETFHQIHCLDVIRQYTYRDEWDYSKTPAFDAEPHLVRAHVDHCIETIRLNLMCAGDVTPFLTKSSPSRPLGELPDFNTKHKCRNFTKLQEWMWENSIPA